MLRSLRIVAAVLTLTAAAYRMTAAPARADAGACRAAQGQTATAGEQRAAPGGSLAFIVNRSNPVEDLSFAELRQYFLGERTHWPNGRRVTLVMRDATRPEREAVLRAVYEMREQDYRAHFLRAKFTGEVQEEPRELDTTSRVVNFVFLQPGAVGYVRADEVGPSVKVLRLDGLMPGDAGYRLTF
jgi:ABC-type phosphate transport system substrate-binding protein